MSAKGSTFERSICRELSLWWTEGKDDSVFWRTAGSGGMATRRGQKGKNTLGHTGDIMATDSCGAPLTKLCCIELKIGYGKWSFLDVVDRPEKGAKQTIEKFMEQMTIERENCKAPFSVLIFHRDRRETCIMIPFNLYRRLAHYCGQLPKHIPYLTFRSPMEEYDKATVIPFTLFKSWCNPSVFQELHLLGPLLDDSMGGNRTR